MSKKRRSNDDGFVFSTDPEFEYEDDALAEESIPFENQKLLIFHDKKQRKGKVVTMITGFVGPEDELVDLSKTIKSKCGVGGSAKNGEIIIQGALAEKAMNILREMGASVKRSGG